jgi:hypothetical protein
MMKWSYKDIKQTFSMPLKSGKMPSDAPQYEIASRFFQHTDTLEF